MSVFLLILGIVLFIGLVVVHEWGHFIAARRGGVEVEEFGIGFPPKVWGKKVKTKKSKFLFTINLLPLGGFVRLKGESDDATAKGSYGAAPLKTKVKIMLAGVTMNFLVACLILTALAATALPKIDLASLPFYGRNQFTITSDTKRVSNDVYIAVEPGTPAEKAGIKTGDRLVRIGNDNVENAGQLSSLTEKYKGQTTEVIINSNGSTVTKSVSLNRERSDKGYLGVSPRDSEYIRTTWSAPIVGIVTTVQYAEVTVRGLGYVVQSLFKGDTKTASEQVVGPVGIVVILNDISHRGLSLLLFLIANISLTLAVMNILPIPALDGGRLFVTLIFRALKKRLTKNREEWIHGTGFVALLGLIILITIVDIKRFF